MIKTNKDDDILNPTSITKSAPHSSVYNSLYKRKHKTQTQHIITAQATAKLLRYRLPLKSYDTGHYYHCTTIQAVQKKKKMNLLRQIDTVQNEKKKQSILKPKQHGTQP